MFFNRVLMKDEMVHPTSNVPAICVVQDEVPFRDQGAYRLRSDNLVQKAAPIHGGEEMFVAVFQQAAIGIVLLNSDGSIRDVNPFICRMLGYARDEAIGKDFRDFGHPDDRAET